MKEPTPHIPNALERLVLLTANQGPGPSLGLFGAVGFRTAIAASKIGLFVALETEQDQTPSNLAKQLGLDERAVRSLMALLESLGYVRSRSGLYRLTKMSRKWMLQTSEVPHIDFLRWWHDVTFPFWDEQILDVLERGGPAVSIYDWMDGRTPPRRVLHSSPLASITSTARWRCSTRPARSRFRARRRALPLRCRLEAR